MRFVVDSRCSSLTAHIRSNVHDFQVVWHQLRGDIVVDPSALANGAEVSIEVDMNDFDAGDRLRNRKLRSDLELDKNPRAWLDQVTIKEIVQAADGEFEGAIAARLRYRGCESAVVVWGQGKIDAQSISLTCEMSLRMQELGIVAPRFLMFRVADEVRLNAAIQALACEVGQ